MKSMIRWPGLGIFAVSLLTICIFSLFFVDSIIESIIEDQGTDLNGAKVELERADFSFFPTGLELHGLQVTDPDEPMQNLVAIDRIACSIDPMKLLQRKIIIDEMAVEGVKPNSPRKRSGAISKPTTSDSAKKKEASAPKDKKKTDNTASFNMPNAKEVLAKEELNTLALTSEYQSQFKADKELWQQKLSELPDKDKLTDYKKRIKKLSSGGVAAIIKNASKLKSLKKEIKADIKLLKSSKKEFEQLTATYKERLKKLKIAPQQDIDRLTDKYALTGTGLANISGLLFGAKVGDKIDMALSWYEKAQPMIDNARESLDSEETEKVPRGKGVDVRFKEHTPLPDFLIRTITASVVTVKGDISGTIKNITQNQRILGLPTTFLFQGDSLQGVGSLTIDGILDHIEPDKPSDSFKLEISDYAIAKSGGNDGKSSAPSLTGGLLDISAQGNIKKESIDARIETDITSATFAAFASEGKDLTSRSIAKALSGITEFTAKAEVTGTLEDYNVRLSSDLDKILQQALADNLKAEEKRFKKELRTLVMEQTKDPLNAAGSGLDELDSISKDLRDRLKIGDKLL